MYSPSSVRFFGPKNLYMNIPVAVNDCVQVTPPERLMLPLPVMLPELSAVRL